MTLLDLDTPPLPPMLCLGGCGKLLWDPKSRKRQYGRECAEKAGIIDPSSPRFSRRDGGDCPGQANLLEAAVTEYITSDGASDIHSRPDCEKFQEGQQGSRKAGYQVHALRLATEAEVRKRKRCPECLPEAPEGTTP